MGQAKNRGTREQRVIAAIARGTRDTEFTVTGRIPSQPVVQELAPEPRVEIVSPVIESDYAKIEERVLSHGYSESDGNGLFSYQRRILDVLREKQGRRIAIYSGRRTLALAALAASALAEIGHSTVVIDERSSMKGFDDGKQD